MPGVWSQMVGLDVSRHGGSCYNHGHDAGAAMLRLNSSYQGNPTREGSSILKGGKSQPPAKHGSSVAIELAAAAPSSQDSTQVHSQPLGPGRIVAAEQNGSGAAAGAFTDPICPTDVTMELGEAREFSQSE